MNQVEKGPTTISVAGDDKTFECSAVVLVPDVVLSEPGHIRTLSVDSGPQAKHAFYALAQTAAFQFQDEELRVTIVEGSILAGRGQKTDAVKPGMVICRTVSGEIVILSNSKKSHRKLLDATQRFCTRWIRLDI